LREKRRSTGVVHLASTGASCLQTIQIFNLKIWLLKTFQWYTK
jgi:hypothetical protein